MRASSLDFWQCIIEFESGLSGIVVKVEGAVPKIPYNSHAHGCHEQSSRPVRKPLKVLMSLLMRLFVHRQLWPPKSVCARSGLINGFVSELQSRYLKCLCK